MGKSPTMRFTCANCGGVYEVMRLEAPIASSERQIKCICCGVPLRGRDGNFILKYFLVSENSGKSRQQWRRSMSAFGAAPAAEFTRAVLDRYRLAVSAKRIHTATSMRG